MNNATNLKAKKIHSVTEFKKMYFPKYFAKQSQEKIMSEPGKFGEMLAVNLIKNIVEKIPE